MSRILSALLLPLIFIAPLRADPADIFARPNIAAWCIVPYDGKKRSPEERAGMVAKIGLKRIAYDWRQQHVPEFEREILAYQKHGIEFFAFWGVHDEALRLFEKYKLHPQLWVTIQGKGETQEAKVKSAAEGLLPVLAKAKAIGSQVGIYNHGGWGGEPENMVAVSEFLKKNHGTDNVGIVYNLHHGHGHLDRLSKVLEAMKPHLLCFNLNGMDVAGDTRDRKILPLGVGTEDVKVLRILRESGWRGPVGILNHTDEDAEGRLLDNLDGLRWLLPQLDGAKPDAKPKWRTWTDMPVKTSDVRHPGPGIGNPIGAPSLSDEFGRALAGGLLIEGKADYRAPPFTVECRAKLDGSGSFNILVACNPKSAGTHWEIYTHAGRGTFALFMPGRGGDFDSNVPICDGKWHDLLASVDGSMVSLWVDGRLVLEKATTPAGAERPPPVEQLAFGRLVEGTPGCEGVIDDVRISRGVMKPRKSDSPRLWMDNTIGLWSFDHLGTGAPVVRLPEPAPFAPELKPLRVEDCRHWQAFVNRERVFDWYGKQAIEAMKVKPAPALLAAFPGLDGGKHGHWGNQNDQVTWKDARWAESDLGSVFSGVFQGRRGLTVPKAVCVYLGGPRQASACFDPAAREFVETWEGGFLTLNATRHGFGSGARMKGTGTGEGRGPGPADRTPFVYRGFYRSGKDVVFAYEQSGALHLTAPTLNADGSIRIVTDVEGAHPMRAVLKGGPAQWPDWVETKGERVAGAPFATDTIAIPFKNPYGTLFFLSGHDFFSDGSAAVATMTGEVWLVRDIDSTLERVRWKRFATGLHQPLGVRIVGDRIHVLGRDQITRLHDLNGDDEADFYECVTNAMTTSPGGHDYITGLDADAQGRWHFASGNQGICRITGRDRLDVLATGLRNPNGLGLSPDGRFVTSSLQEGDWTPASAICQIEPGKNEGAHFGAGGPRNGRPPEPPLLYLPRGEDNSSGGQCFITGDAWSSLKGNGNLIHLSSGGGSAWLVMRQEVNGRWQGAAVRISGNFDSGVQAGRFHPRDGHFYATGMQGWGSYTPLDGCFQRVRFNTNAVTPVPVAFDARDNGVLLRFDKPLEAARSANPVNHFAQCWNYRYSAAYGSPEFSVRHAGTTGHDPLEIRSAHVLEAGKTLFLEIPQLIPAGQIHLRVRVTEARSHDIFLTAHALAPAFKDFPGYESIAKTPPPSPAVATMVPPPAKPNPWTKGEAGRAIAIEAGLGLQFAQKQFAVKAGERVSLTFTNPDAVPHNWVLAKPGTLNALGDQANKLITDPTGLARHYIPDSRNVIVYTDMVNPTGNFTIHFTAPAAKGDYPYLCTFPGHWMVMNGVMKVE